MAVKTNEPTPITIEKGTAMLRASLNSRLENSEMYVYSFKINYILKFKIKDHTYFGVDWMIFPSKIKAEPN